MNKEQIKEKYLSSAILYRLLGKKRETLLTIISVLRFLTFFGGLVLVWIGFTFSVSDGVILILLFTVLFLWQLKLFSEHSEKREFLSNLASINQNEADALSGDLKAFDAGNSYSDIRHDFSFDVDLFGTSSLFQYLNRTVTDYGKDILASWLSDPFILSKDLLPRQKAIKELASKDKWRHKFMATGMKTPLEKDEISSLLDWMQERALFSSSALSKIMILSLPAASIVSLVLAITGVLPYPVFVFIFLGNLLYIAAGLKRINTIHNSLSRKYKFLSSIDRLLKAFENESFNSPLLNDIKLNISGKNISAARSVKKLGRLIQAFDSRNNQIVGLVLNGLFLWDYHSIYRLEKWKSEYKTMFPLWLEMIGQVDAYISLGNYAFNNPDFVFPAESENPEVFSAKNLGHQLIDESKRVCNDFSLGKKGNGVYNFRCKYGWEKHFPEDCCSKLYPCNDRSSGLCF